ncbi:MAG: CPBP family intramembrane metalloprotease, partial [bacterium]|nr:CPBP family intramembrane metalloprotease [bacterium]
DLGPEGFEQAAAFRLDDSVQAFVELEAGGKEAFREMLSAGLYSPYTWRVRHFKPGETTETELRFTPAGEPYGFVATLPEDQPGPSLEPDAGRAIAERAAAGDWRIALEEFELVESSQELRPGGRTDHTFVYERSGVVIGEGRYRLRLVTSGDRFTELSHFIKVPEGFFRRFAEMRAANSAIDNSASIVSMVLYLGCGCLGGLFFLLRRRSLLWKQALICAGVIALLELVRGLNRWPLWWMNYDTAVGAGNFVIANFFGLFAGFVGLGLMMAVSFMAAEGLTRHAFGRHVQLWRTWSPAVAATPSILGATVGPFVMLGIWCGYRVALYFFSNQFLGWWTPSSPLTDPNVLATWFPWLEPIAISLRAGFLEECLYRAVPLAGAALLGRRFGRPRLWIIGALIFQAVIFGAVHASYPTMPAYARLVELILPAIGYGLFYLRFGLLASILLHFAFDVVAISLPIFASSASGAWIDQTLVVLLALVPLGVVLAARRRRGRWSELDESFRNHSWTPPAVASAPESVVVPRPALDPRAGRWLVAAGLAGLVLWIAMARSESDAPPLATGRSQAEAAAREALAGRGLELADDWWVLSTVRAEVDDGHRFIWQEGGRELYRDLLGRYLEPPRWRVRFARFTGDVAERAEEYRVWISPRGEVVRFEHWLPEHRAGASLSEEEARSLAHAELAETFALGADELVEVAAVPAQQPARRDWRFTFRDPAALSVDAGEARIAVALAGGEVVDSYRFVEVPEPWERAERDRRTLAGVLQRLAGLVLIPVFLAGAVAGVVCWSRKRFAGRVALVSLAILAGLGLAFLVLRWPVLMAGFSTARPLELQVLMSIIGPLVLVLAVAAGVALNLGFLSSLPELRVPSGLRSTILRGLALGTAVAGLTALASRVRPALAPEWPDYAAAAGWLPFFAAALFPLATFVGTATVALLIFTAVDRFSAAWTRRRVLSAGILLVVGLVVSGGAVTTVRWWLADGVLLGAMLIVAYVLVLRRQLSLVPLAVAAMVALGTLEVGFLRGFPGGGQMGGSPGGGQMGGFPAALPGAVAAAILIVLAAVGWTRKLAAQESSAQS